MHTLTITSIEKKHSIPDSTDFLEVSFSIALDGEEVHAGIHGFPLESTEDEIKESLNQVLTTFLSDQELSASNEEADALNNQADAVIANLSGLSLNAEINQ